MSWHRREMVKIFFSSALSVGTINDREQQQEIDLRAGIMAPATT
jgi:hypothetical protein